MTDMTGRPISNYPTNHVVGFIHHELEVASAQAALRDAGYNKFQILSGEFGLSQLDPPNNKWQGMLGRAKRLFHKLGDEETRLFKIAEHQLRNGDSLMMIETNGMDDQIEAVRQLLVAQHAHTLIFFGAFVVQRLDSAQALVPIEA